jgi:hypothetical protein
MSGPVVLTRAIGIARSRTSFTNVLFSFFFRRGVHKPFRPTSQDGFAHRHRFLSLTLSLLPPMRPTLVTLTVRGFLLRTSHD